MRLVTSMRFEKSPEADAMSAACQLTHRIGQLVGEEIPIRIVSSAAPRLIQSTCQRMSAY